MKNGDHMLREKIVKHFRLLRNPFVDDVRGVDDVFMSSETRYVLHAMRDAAQAQGIVAVVADSGAGKTTLRRMLIEELRTDDKVSVIMPSIIDKSRVTAAGLCEAIIADVSDETPKRSLEAKARQVERLLRDSSRSGQHHVMIIEEAHDLTIPAFSYLKALWNLEEGRNNLLGIVLIGNFELNAKFILFHNSQARELIRRCIKVELQPLENDLQSYLQHKFTRVGSDLNKILEPDAVDAIFQRLRRKENGSVVSDVYPLAVNNLLVSVMNLAADLGDERVTAELVLNA